MLSNNLEFKKLLLLHGKDRRKQSMETELENLPHSISHIDSKIELENATIASATEELQNLEIESNSLENEINSLSEQIVRQKNKQLEVKKNEEYQALENEIAGLINQQSQKEDEHIEILLKLDDAKETSKIAESKIREKVKLLEIDRKKLSEKGTELNSEVARLNSEIEETIIDIDESLILGYSRTKKVVSRPPYIAPLEEQKCSGCNLRVSNDVVSSVLVEQKLTHCDQCGRIVYFER
jgi:predicted  nucleic acid-binding Zn-ribbon protein